MPQPFPYATIKDAEGDVSSPKSLQSISALPTAAETVYDFHWRTSSRVTFCCNSTGSTVQEKSQIFMERIKMLKL